MIVEYDGNFDLDSGKRALWFSIPGCPPCKVVEGFMEGLSDEFTDIAIVHVDAEKWGELVERFEVPSPEAQLFGQSTWEAEH